jgi:uncharacterized repeat protein (TIGR03837 family)
MDRKSHWDIFCKIIDNFGDIGVCWRLSQQLAHEHSLQIRLVIDDIHVAQKIIPELDISKPQQNINAVEIVTWSAIETSPCQVADVVIETFGCELPEPYLQQMSAETIWINLEYLSAENWVSDFHARPSKHPSLALTKYYFFPGFADDTGGLIREQDLLQRRDTFLASSSEQTAFWQKLNLKMPDPDAIKVSLFCYLQASIKQFLAALSSVQKPVHLFVPFHAAIVEIGNLYPDFKPNIGEVFRSNQLSIHILPFLTQEDYDYLLWSCDLNFVRGEDSWIRAIWAGRPFVWQPYIQQDHTHLEKLKAFLARYTENALEQDKALIHQVNLVWSGYGSRQQDTDDQTVWHQLLEAFPKLNIYTKKQSDFLAKDNDLATKLVIFSENLQKNQV